MRDDKLPFAKSNDSLATFFKIFLAVFLAGLAIYAVRAAIAYWAIQQVQEDFHKTVSIINAQSQAQIVAIQERQQREQERIQQLKMAEAERKRTQQAEQVARVQRETDMANAKEDAWLKFYKPKPECSESNSSRDFIECGNEYHRAKAKFEQVWQSKISN